MAWSAVSSAMTTIGGLITKEAISLWGVQEQADSLQRELEWMQSFLKDADSRQGESERIRTWVSEIRELAYDAEDVVEAFSLKIGSKRKCGFSNVVKRSACIHKEGWILRTTRLNIEKITARFTILTQQLQRYDYVVRLEDDIKKLVSILVEEESQYQIASICGMGGLGKTTLAKRFTIIARGSMLSDDELAGKLFNFLKEKKCLVILDDIWSIEAWDSLKSAFPMRDTRSKILLTPRNKVVASHEDRRGYLHELVCLKEESWELFQKTAFPERDISPDYIDDERMEEWREIIVKHCAGLPLAIIVLGGVLATKNSLKEWQMVFENVMSILKRGEGSEGHGTDDVLALSYDDLPPYLRHCFLYLSHFPEDYEIDAKGLIQLWVAEGIVSSKQEEGNGGEIIEHVAERFLIELVQRYVLNNFKLLRVLGFERTNSKSGLKLSSDIGNLIHLRFLSLCGLFLSSSKLPSSLGNLRCLQTLDLRVKKAYSDYIQVPNVIWRMEQIRHLYLPDIYKCKPKLKLGTLRNLQTLVNFSTRICYVEDLLNMTNLSELKIRMPFNMKDFKEDLENNSPILASKYLLSLSIILENYYDIQDIDPRHFAHLLSSCVNICELSLWVKIQKLPEYHHFSSSIACIHLGLSYLKEDPMPTLGKLRNLRIFELSSEAFTGKEMVCSAQCFPKLDSLSLDNRHQLEEWKVDEGAMPALRHLRICNCSGLKKLPDGLRFITALQELKIEEMQKAFKDKLVEGGEDFYKVQHVPSFIFQNCVY
ncbi:hypothetical protein CRYUN_Cryun11dG0040400 [Craigia yunnanensis]